MNTQTVDTLPSPPNRPANAHKGSFGSVLIIAGSRGMSGAAALAGLGALRGGAGLVYVATPVGIQPIVAGIEPSFLTIGLPENERGQLAAGALEALTELAVGKEVIAIGPGVGQSPDTTAMVTALYQTLPQPMVVDADALNVLAAGDGSFSEHAGPRILSPHPGEFSRMIGRPVSEVQAEREGLATQFSAEHDVVLLLKGPGTIITDGTRVAHNSTGNSGMATGGSGDVLTGLIAALLAQGMNPFEAAQLAAWMHGRAGDLVAHDLSEPGMIASDLPRYLGRVWLELAEGAPGD